MSQETHIDEVIRLSWHCGNYVGAAKWQNTEDFEPDDCGTEFETEDTRDNWEEKFCCATCPRCGSELTQGFDLPEIIRVLRPHV